jgi:lipopolysaccharide export system permease protein
LILFKYLSREVLVTMLTVTVVVLVISIGSRFSGYLNEAASGALSKDILFLLITYRIPKFLELIIPISFFLSLMLVYGRMHVDSEMVVLEACGTSPARIILITLCLSLVVVSLNAVVALWLKPVSEARVQNLFASQRNLTEFDTLAPGRFQTLRSGKRVTYTEDFTDKGQLAKVFMNEYKETNFYGAKDVITLVSETGETQVDENNNRFLVLNDGYRFSGKPGESNYQVIQFEEYGQLIDKEVAAERAVKEGTKSTIELSRSNDVKDIAEFQWRISIILIIPVMALMAIPLSKVNPRQGRFTRLVPGMSLCFFYVVALSGARSSLVRGNLPVDLGLWWIHGLFIFVTFLLFRMDHFGAIVTAVIDRFRPPAKA